MRNIDWNNLAKHESFRAVIDPNDLEGVNSSPLDQIHWNAIFKKLEGEKFISTIVGQARNTAGIKFRCRFSKGDGLLRCLHQGSKK